MDSMVPDMRQSEPEGTANVDVEPTSTEAQPEQPETNPQGEQEPEAQVPEQPEQNSEPDYEVDENGNVVLSEARMKELLGKEKSYSHLQPKFTQTAQKLSELRKAASQQAQPETAPPNLTAADVVPPQNVARTQNGPITPVTPKRGANPTQNILASLTDIVQKAVSEQLSPVQEKIRETEQTTNISNTVTALARTNKEEFDQVMPEAYKVLETTPELWALGEEKALNTAYSIARGTVLKAELSNLVQEGVDARTKNKQYKQQMPKDKNQANANAGKGKTAEQKIADDIVALAQGGSNVGSAFLS